MWFINGQPLADVAAAIADVAARPRVRAPVRYGLSAFVVARESEEEAEAELAYHWTLKREFDQPHAQAIFSNADPKAQMFQTARRNPAIGTNGGTAAGLVGSYDQVAERILQFQAIGIGPSCCSSSRSRRDAPLCPRGDPARTTFERCPCMRPRCQFQPPLATANGLRMSDQTLTGTDLGAYVITGDEEAIAVAHAYAEQIRPGAAARDAERQLPLAELQALGRSGLLAITIPPEYGGAGVSFQTLAEVFRIISAADGAIGQIPQNHFHFVGTIERAGSEAQKRFFFGEVLRGARLGNALSERGPKRFGSGTAGAFSSSRPACSATPRAATGSPDASTIRPVR